MLDTQLAHAHGQPPQPPPVDRRERVRLYVAGWVDGWRYRRIPDADHTHLTLRLAAEHDSGRVAVVEWAARSRHRLAAELAGIGPADGDRPVLERQPPRDSGELVGLDRRGRHAWAAANRHAAAQQRDDAACVARWQQQVSRARVLVAQESQLAEVADVAEERWRAHLDQRLAIYTRARIRGSVRVPSAAARLPTLADR